jgi:hypothetical protein
MGKTKINFQSLTLLLFLTLTRSSYSQESFTKELKWIPQDSISEVILQDTNQIVEWGIYAHATYKSENLYIEDKNVFILIVDVCSGIYCYNISVFRKENKNWRLITSTNANLTQQIKIKVDNEKQKIIFRTKSGQIGELPFETLNLGSDLTK